MVEMAGISIHLVNVLLTSSLSHARASTARLSFLVSIEPLFVPWSARADLKKPPGTSPAVFSKYGGDGGNRTRVQKGSTCCLLS
ncbi:MAG: hypothetical protein ACI9QC_000340 [Oceanicoccus sp.]|jgi:hypothetical protein